MKKNLLLISFLIGGSSFMSSQTTITSTINAALDDHEERILGALTQNGTVGDMYPGSTGLELGSENVTSNPILVGLRFTNITVPKFATITNAYIQFTVKGTSKNTDPCTLSIQAENSANAATFSDNANTLSGRTKAAGAVSWAVGGASWGTIGSSTADQRTSDIKSLVQPLVFNNNWVSGNAMAFFIKGPGLREVESFEGDPAKAAQLVVTYSVSGGTSTLTTGMMEQNSGTHLTVYPNPFKSSFNLNVEVKSSSDVNVSVYDHTGKLVESKSVKQADPGIFYYSPTTPLNSGMYFVKVQANGKTETMKLIAE